MLFGAAALCAISMVRVDWQGEADKAREESLREPMHTMMGRLLSWYQT